MAVLKEASDHMEPPCPCDGLVAGDSEDEDEDKGDRVEEGDINRGSRVAADKGRGDSSGDEEVGSADDVHDVHDVHDVQRWQEPGRGGDRFAANSISAIGGSTRGRGSLAAAASEGRGTLRGGAHHPPQPETTVLSQPQMPQQHANTQSSRWGMLEMSNMLFGSNANSR